MNSADTGPLKVGVIGCGAIAYWVHLPLLERMNGVELVAASDPDPAARARAATIIGAPVVEAADEIIGNSDIDAVVICAPTNLHAELAISAMKAGKHVMVEKPIATTADDARRVVAAAAVNGLSATIGFNRRTHPLFEQAKKLISSGGLGTVRAIQSAFCEPMTAQQMGSWRQRREAGGGVLLDLASHHVDLVRWLLDDEVESVDCSTWSEMTDVDTATLSFAMRKGAVVQGFFSYRAARADYVELIGEKGTVMIDYHTTQLRIRVSRRMGYGTRRQLARPGIHTASWRVRRLIRPSLNPSYQRALAAFVSSIRGGPEPVASLMDGLRSLNVVLAAEESARSGKRVRVEG